MLPPIPPRPGQQGPFRPSVVPPEHIQPGNVPIRQNININIPGNHKPWYKKAGSWILILFLILALLFAGFLGVRLIPRLVQSADSEDLSTLFQDSFSGNSSSSPGFFESLFGFQQTYSDGIHQYIVFDNGINDPDEMIEFCKSLGGHLATITTEQEDNYVYTLLKSKGYDSAYFGLFEDEDGNWTWVTGEPVNYLNWAEGEPNNTNAGENQGMYYKVYPDGKWNDGNSVNESMPFICEFETSNAYIKALNSV